MLGYALLSILNGAIFGASRSLNGRLSNEVGPMRASFWNHSIGFLFLTLAFLILGTSQTDLALDGVFQAPLTSYLGGIFGVLFLAVNSTILPRLGSNKSILIVIAGQMIASVLIEARSCSGAKVLAQLFGVTLILLGVYLSRRAKSD